MLTLLDVFGVLLLVRRRPSHLIPVVLTSIFVLVSLFLYLALWYKLPPRVILPALYCTNLAYLWAALTSNRSTREPLESSDVSKSTLRVVSFSLLALGYVCCVFFVAVDLVQHDRFNRQAKLAYDDLVSVLITDFGSNATQPLWIVWGAAFPMEYDLLFSRHSELSQLQTISLGWLTHSPHYNAMLKRHAIQDISKATFERPDIVYVSSYGATMFSRINRYLEEHIGETVDWKLLRTLEFPQTTNGNTRYVFLVQPTRILR